MMFTVLGGKGFIGSNLAGYLRAQGFSVYTPSRDCNSDNLYKELLDKELGHVFYCIGLTANFRQRPFDTIEAHVCMLKHVLEKCRIQSLTYLSSTRVYEGSVATNELATLQGMPAIPGHLYNFSKLLGESLCLNSGVSTKVVRLSNVYGKNTESRNFLSAVLSETAQTGHLKFLTSPDSSKDFISVLDVVRLLPLIAIDGKQQIYNLASGRNTTNADIANVLKQQGVSISYAPQSPTWSFPTIDIKRLTTEFGQPDDVLEADLPELFNYFRLRV